jgi:hypothetical protein
MRKFLIALVLMIGAFFIIAHFAQVQAIVETIQRGDWRYLTFALIVELTWVLNLAASFRAIYHALGMDEDIKQFILMATAANFINVVAPSAGMGGLAIFISRARQRNHPVARATVAGALFILFDYIGILCILALGLIALIRRNRLNSSEIVASIIIASIALGLIILLYLGMRSERELGQALAWLARQVNCLVRPFLHREYLSEQRAYTFAHDAAEGIRLLREKPHNLLLPFALGLTNKVYMLSVFFLMFLAFKVPLSPGTLVAGFSIGYLFTIVSPTPAGIGIVEPALTLALRSMYVPLGAAAVVTLSYRGFTFWLPLLIGMLSVRFLEHGQAKMNAESAPPDQTYQT